MNILNLPDWEIGPIEDQPDKHIVPGRYLIQPDACIKCGTVGGLQKFGTLRQQVHDLPTLGKQTVIDLSRQRYRCKDCKATFVQPIPDIDDRGTITKRLLPYIGRQALKHTFAHVAEEVGVTEGTIRNFFHEHVAALDKTFKPITPEWLGLDEIHLTSKVRAVVANVKENAIVDILPSREKAAIQRYLQLMPNRGRVQLVTIDMWKPYKEAVESVLPGTVIVVDKFHVVRMANEAVDKVRLHLRDGMTDKERRRLMHDKHILAKRPANLTPKQALTLDTWLSNVPMLKEAYDEKETFYALWEVDTAEKFIAGYTEWSHAMSPGMRSFFKDLLTAVANWQTEIAAYFTHRATNAFTESLNNLIRAVSRSGRGYSFDVLRAKMLYTTRKAKPVKDTTVQIPDDINQRFLELINSPTFDIGVDIETLTACLQASESTPSDESEQPAE